MESKNSLIFLRKPQFNLEDVCFYLEGIKFAFCAEIDVKWYTKRFHNFSSFGKIDATIYTF